MFVPILQHRRATATKSKLRGDDMSDFAPVGAAAEWRRYWPLPIVAALPFAVVCPCDWLFIEGT